MHYYYRASDIGAGLRGDRSHELSGHYPFDLLVLRGATLAASGERDKAPLGLLLGLSYGSRRGDEHFGQIFYPREGF
jgi:hypothetical protein